jgi:hypothetical protein
MKLSFVPIARRDLKYTSPTHSMDVVLAISAPYRPPSTPMAAGRVAACMVQDCDDPTLALEVGGDDEFEALQMGLIHLEKFIERLNAEKVGKLVNRDGTPFQAKNSSLMAYFLDSSRV